MLRQTDEWTDGYTFKHSSRNKEKKIKQKDGEGETVEGPQDLRDDTNNS